MDGERIRSYWTSEARSLLATYKQFETLIPSSTNSGADHTGEDGRFVEDLLREYLRKHLPKGLEVLTGFVFRPAVKTRENGRERASEKDTHSSQLDILVYDSANYPVFQRFGDSAVVVPEGVIGIISVKKTLRDGDIQKECRALTDAARLCQNIFGRNGELVRGPYLAVVAATSTIEKVKMGTLDWVFSKISEQAQLQNARTFDELVGYVGVLDAWGIFKRRPKQKGTRKADYIGFEHKADEEHLLLQFLLTGLLSVYHDQTRNIVPRPGFTAFPTRTHDQTLGSINVGTLR